MTASNGDTPQKHPSHDKDRRPDQGTVLDRIKMPPMSGEEALRRFNEGQSSANGAGNAPQPGELENLHPIIKLMALGGTLVLIVAVLLGVLYLFAA
ncbi:MAG: hypothetical protein JJ871_07510 [Thalassospira sp.]|jgi:hypothetical protein|uniref:hypothetical protein n=1 Tax=Thalassospira sp. TaxID=1912094 RepID=UPI001B1C26F4|nr:hypothetical protein [Thalassospira sp.]MBO6579377.1 hypothetical protein [Thalassospira sp.]MBO6802385.1 hypothetical protein [Thalassospira sp.]MBO6817364.1 hypothetical protein [Thalassospira sp.]MBO6887896.1 hypothetical protein [Thalassospira sp.]